jgi:hypothetical protein
MTAQKALRQVQDSILITIQVQPRARKTAWAGRSQEAFKLKVAEPPKEGRANRAIVEFVAESLGVPKSSVAIIQGETSRRKVLAVWGIGLEEAESRLLEEVG